jgi:hypothetical protein
MNPPLLVSTWLPVLGDLALALALLVGLLAVGTALGRSLGVHQWGIPEALLAGTLGLLIAPGGGLVALIPPRVIAIWDQLPLILLTLVFGTLLTTCAAGTFRRNNGAWASTHCLSCPVGMYCPLGTVDPLPCQAGTFRTSVGATDSAQCADCPAGGYCPARSSAPIRA